MNQIITLNIGVIEKYTILLYYGSLSKNTAAFNLTTNLPPTQNDPGQTRTYLKRNKENMY